MQTRASFAVKEVLSDSILLYLRRRLEQVVPENEQFFVLLAEHHHLPLLTSDLHLQRHQEVSVL